MQLLRELVTSEPSNLVRSNKSDRLVWVDIARGICMILVVVMHFDEMHYSQLFEGNSIARYWDYATSIAKPARLPAFFIISGILASAAVFRDWNQVFEKRVKFLYYIYFMWMIIHLIVLYLIFTPADSTVAAEFAYRVAIETVWPQTQLWFVYSLILFFLISRIFRSHQWVILSLALLMSAFAELIPYTVASQMSRSFFFFLLGAYLPNLITNFAASRDKKLLFWAGLAYALAVALIVKVGENIPGIWIPASFVGVVLICSASRVLADIGLTQPFELVGRQTLPIYVMHGPVIMIMQYTITEIGLIPANHSAIYAFLSFSYPIIGNILVIALCLVIYQSLKKVGLGWLFELPAWAQSTQPESK